MKQNNFKDIFTVIKFTMKDMLSRKSFRISTIIIVLLIVIGFNVPSFIENINGNDLGNAILLVDQDNAFDGKLSELQATNSEYKIETSDDNYETIKDKIEKGDIDSAIIIESHDNSLKTRYIVKNAATITQTPQSLIDQINQLYTKIQIDKIGLTDKQIQSLYPNFEFTVEQTEAEIIGGNIFVMMILSCLLFFAIYFCAFQVSSSITVEKTSKIMETLVTSTSPRTIVLGKTIGIGIVGLLQILLFSTVAIISAYSFLDPEILNTMLDLSNFTPYLAIVIIVYFILGYFTYAFLYALTGSTVSKPEDIQSANTPIAILSMIGFYLAYFTLTNPTGELNVVASLLPISSPFCMPLRVMMGIANGWDVVLSIIILLATCVIIAHIAIKIYSNAILNYGNRLTLRDIIKSYREK